MFSWWTGYEGRRDYEDLLEGNPNRETLRGKLLDNIDPQGFKWRVFIVAASGFLADSYAIFSTNVVSPALAYIYWPEATEGNKGLIINTVTLLGSCIGMISFGVLADVFGRKRLYGVELIIGIIATIGLAQVSAGYNQHSMNAFAWIVWWRFALGIAIGAEYPLSSLIAAEWSATSTRGTMLAAVFLMQPIGQFLAYIVGYASLVCISRDQLPNWGTEQWDKDKTNRDWGVATIDAVWRCVIGAGAIPTLLAIALRLTIPETPRYLIDVKEDLPAAAQATRNLFPKKKDTPAPSRKNSDKKSKVEPEISLTSKEKNTADAQSSSVGVVDAGLKQRVANKPVQDDEIKPADNPRKPNDQGVGSDKSGGLKVSDQDLDRASIQSGQKPEEEEKKPKFWDEWRTIHKKGQGFRRILAGISICWFLMDVCFYGLGLDSSRALGKIWGSQASDATPSPVYDWNSGFANKDENIYDALLGDATRALWTIPLSAIPGCVIFLLLVDYIPRVTVLRWTFVVLAILFAITGSSLFAVFETNHHDVTVVFYAFALFVLNVGPNTILFMLPAEIFPTKYRGTCYGIAAASGKAGAIVIQLIVHFAKVTSPETGKMRLAVMLICFTPLMLIGAFVAWVWIPEVQHPREKTPEGKEKEESFRKRMLMPPRSLEDISRNPREGQIFGLREHLSHFFGRVAKIAQPKTAQPKTADSIV